jgi:HSP20 family molecular chaperone IbpA
MGRLGAYSTKVEQMSPRDARTWMWAEACGLIERAEQLQRQFFRYAGDAETAASWEPPVDVVVRGDEVSVTVALPGVAPEHVQLQIVGDALYVVAARAVPLAAVTGIYRLEIPHGRFERRIPLPEGQYEVLERACVHGCLQLRLVRR